MNNTLQTGTGESQPLFSFFRAPISNTRPHRTVNLNQVFNAIKGDYYRTQTEALRTLRHQAETGESTRREVQRFKGENFDYATFSGIFSRRCNDALQAHSGLLCLDFDHVEQWNGESSWHRPAHSVAPRSLLQGVYGLRYALLHDEYQDTRLLFRSPGGDGLKWIIAIDLREATHSEWFDAVSRYVSSTYGLEPDPSGRDLARACYLPWDPDVISISPT